MKKLILAVLLLLFVSPAVAVESPYRLKGSLQMGHDSNPHLDSGEKGDFYAAETLDTVFKRHLTDRLRLLGRYDLINANYFEAQNESYLFQEVKGGLNYLLGRQWMLEAYAGFQYLWFFDRPDGDTRTPLGEVAVVHILGRRTRLRGGLLYEFRDFEDRKAFAPEGLASSDDREDDRWRAFASLDFEVLPLVYMHAACRFTDQDSNDQFHNFYDYDSNGLTFGATAHFWNRMKASGYVAYEYREYDQRPIVGNAAVLEENDITTAGASLHWDWRKDLSVGYQYYWRQKDSNEPSQSYIDHVHSLGLYFSF